MKINVHAGHNPAGKIACGAVGILDESIENRKVKDKVISMLKDMGHTVYDCTIFDGIDSNDVLKKIVEKCNAHTVDLDVSIHLNSGRNDYKGDGSIGGTEVWVYTKKSTQKERAAVIAKEIGALGFRIRGDNGVQISEKLYVLKNTKAPALLIEICFVDDKDDADLYKKVGVNAIAKAIVQGITGKKYTTSTPATSTNAAETNYIVRITTDVLNVRKGPGTDYDIVTKVKKGDAFTIVEEKNGWGRLKSDAGWISLVYTEKV